MTTFDRVGSRVRSERKRRNRALENGLPVVADKGVAEAIAIVGVGDRRVRAFGPQHLTELRERAIGCKVRRGSHDSAAAV